MPKQSYATAGVPEDPAETDKSWLEPDGPPEAHIKQTGRWTYTVIVCHGISQWGPNGMPWTVYGRRRAERKARRVLARYLRQRQPDEAPLAVVTVADLAQNGDRCE